ACSGLRSASGEKRPAGLCLIARTARTTRLKEILKPGFDFLGETISGAGQGFVTAARCEAGSGTVGAVQGETDDRGEARSIDGIAEAAEVFRGYADSDAGAKDIGGKLADALHRRGAAGDHHTA